MVLVVNVVLVQWRTGKTAAQLPQKSNFLTHFFTCIVNTDIRFNFISLNVFNVAAYFPLIPNYSDTAQYIRYTTKTSFFRKRLPLWWVNVKHWISSRKGLCMLLRMRHSLTYQKCQHFPKIRKKICCGNEKIPNRKTSSKC